MSGFLSPAIREQIRAASDIVDVIGTYIPLKRAGANFTALCPFHKEKSPSFNVNPQRQIFHCFGCHKGGDVFTFVKEYENIGFMDAVRRLAERAKIPLEFENSPGEQQSRHLKDQLLEIHEQLTARWQSCLANEAAGQRARDYLAQRGVSAEALQLFRLGAAPDAWDDTVNWAKSKKFDLEVVEQAGLIIRKEETGRYYDRFRGRLMFPICNEQDRVIAFSGRVLPGDDSPAKYVNSPETLIFTKSKVFFGLNKSKRAILAANSAIICEGQLDLMACFMAGVQNIVAPQGTAFTDQHARILKRYAAEVVLCFDSDNAGQTAAVRALDHLLAVGLAVRVAVVPAPHDPDSFIKANGGEAFAGIIRQAEGFFDFYLGRLCATNPIQSDKGRLTVLQSMAEAVHKTGNDVLIDTYAQKTALRLGVATEAVRREFSKVGRNTAVPAQAEPEPEDVIASFDEEPIAPPSLVEEHLLKILLHNEDLVGWAAAHLNLDWIPHPHIRQIVDMRFAAQEHETWHTLAEFLDSCEPEEQRRLITQAAAEDRSIPNAPIQLADVTRKLRNEFIDRQIATHSHQINLPETSDEERLRLLHEQQQLRQLKRTPLAPHTPGEV